MVTVNFAVLKDIKFRIL